MRYHTDAVTETLPKSMTHKERVHMTPTYIQDIFFAMGTVNTITVFRREDAEAVRSAKQRVLERLTAAAKFPASTAPRDRRSFRSAAIRCR